MFWRFALLVGFGAMLAGCVSQGPFPSLAPREGEELAIEEPVREPSAVPDDIALRARIAALLEELRRGARTFDAAVGPAERAVARAGADGSDSWIEAQQAISRLEAARGGASAAAAELHRLDLARADLPTSAADREALDAAIAEADRIAANHQSRIDRLRI